LSGTYVDQKHKFVLFQRPPRICYLDQLFRSIHPNSPALRTRSLPFPAKSKIVVLKGLYKNKAGVVLSSFYRHGARLRVIVGDSSVITVKSSDTKLLDPYRILPFGLPLPDSLN